MLQSIHLSPSLCWLLYTTPLCLALPYTQPEIYKIHSYTLEYTMPWCLANPYTPPETNNICIYTLACTIPWYLAHTYTQPEIYKIFSYTLEYTIPWYLALLIHHLTHTKYTVVYLCTLTIPIKVSGPLLYSHLLKITSK